MKANNRSFARVLVFAFMTLFLTALPARIFAAASMGDYCVLPPYVMTNAKPNVMIIMDNAKSMGEPAYCININSADYATNHTCNADNDTIHGAGNYIPSHPYYGYFKNNLRYLYRNNRFEPDSDGVYSGNLLNWATTSKYDVLENILVGGISTSRQTNINTIVSKSNGWKKTFTYVVSGKTYTCIVNVNNANVEFTEPTRGACGLLNPLNNPPTSAVVPPNDLAPLCPSCLSFSIESPVKAPLNETAVFSFSAVETNARYAENHVLQTRGESHRAMEAPSFLKRAAGAVFETVSAMADFLVTDAEAAVSLRIAGGPERLPDGTECNSTTPYTKTISASGGSTSGYEWSWAPRGTSTVTPPGLTLGGTGTPDTTISGIPTASGTYDFTVTVKDSENHTDSKNYSITVNAVPFAITTIGLTSGVKGESYSAALQATAGVCAPYTWSIISSPNILPAGLTLSNAGVISGSPSVTGDFTFTVQVRNSGGRTDTKELTLKITDSAQFTITTDSVLPDGARNGAYSATITAINSLNGVNSWSWVAIDPSTAKPAGLSLKCTGWGTGTCGSQDINTATISGTPTAAGTYYFRITATDNGSKTTSKDFSLTITTEKPLTTGNLNVKICAGDGSTNCTTNENTTSLKSGLIDQFWSQARFGLMSFGHNAEADINDFVKQPASSTPDSNFMTDVENAVAIDDTTRLVNAEFKAIDYYQNNTNNNQNPYEGAKKCTKSFVLIITDGAGANNPSSSPDLFTTDTPDVCTAATLTNLAKNSCYGFNHSDLRPNPPPDDNNTYHVDGRQYVSTYIVNALGTLATTTNPNITPVTTGDTLMQAARKGGGIYYEEQDPALIKAQIEKALKDIIKRAAAGTAASVLASGEGSGANLIQAVFYPRRQFGNDEIDWIGRLANFWYFVDPNLNSSTIREDAGASTGKDDNDADTFAAGDKVLTLKTEPTGTRNDHIVQFFFDTDTQTTQARRWNDNNGNALISDETTTVSNIEFESVRSLWEAGRILWSRSPSSRNIITSISNGATLPFDTTAAHIAALRPNLNASSDAEAQAIIRYTQGEDTVAGGGFSSPAIAGFTGSYRPRSVIISSVSGTIRNTWKLADVLNSTPKISSWLPLNTYHKMYSDNTYGVPGQDPSLQNAADDTKYITSNGYRGRNLIFTGANDGMLHAFKLGTLELHWSGMGEFDKARITPDPDLGKEMWAFIPKNALPYLKYIADPTYCHIYSIDLTPFVFDASIGGPADDEKVQNAICSASHSCSWKTILIGGMRYGGACKNSTSSCTVDLNGDGSIDDKDCVKTPMDGLGYSSYFALDITDQNDPHLLWEFSHPDLGFSTSGPAVVRINGDGSTLSPPIEDKKTNGHWFVVFGSGPTGPINTDENSRQFLGRSDQNLRLFILDLRGPGTGNWTAGTNYWIKNSGIASAFAGSMFNATLDTDLDYQDDVVYIPYVNNSGSGWTDGGVLRLSTNETSTNPVANWNLSPLIENIGPVTSAVTKLQNNSSHKLWTFFGTGRYYFSQDGVADDATSRRRLFGVKEPCFKDNGFDSGCDDPAGTLDNVTDITDVQTNPDSRPGWFIELDEDHHNGTASDPAVRAERVITDPVAASSGIVYFTSFKPYTDECALGGKSFIWAVKYNSGGDASALLKGQALIQVSTGSIEQVDLSKAFRDSVTGLNTGNRKTLGMEGVPPYAQGLSIISTPPPVKRVMHVKER